MKIIKKIFIGITVLFIFHLSNISLFAEPIDQVSKDDRCTVCGMFVAKYSTWITQIHHKDGTVKFFDGVKDMMVYYFNPEKYGTESKKYFTEIWVKDYYSLTWLDARKAFYVTGSDVKGPMGEEFIPFSSNGAAETFMKDHHGQKILKFDEITSLQVESMRHGQMMKMEKMN